MDSSSFPGNVNGDKEGQTQDKPETQNEAGSQPLETPESSNKRKEAPGATEAGSQPPKANKQTKVWSSVWAHYTRTVDNRDKCKCHYCKKIYCCASSSGTSNLKKHLLTCKHYQAWEQHNRRKNQTQTGLTNDGGVRSGKVTEAVFREASNKMLVLGELPLAFVESIAFKTFCEMCNLYSPHSRRTATRDIVQLYVQKKAALKAWIVSSKQRVSLTTDIWVAHATGASYMVITMHFVDKNWRLRKFIIGFKYVTDHKGQTISCVLLSCLAEWGIEKVFTITVDNATANTSALRKFQRGFSALRNDAFVLDGEFMHVRCCAHIINLVVKDGLHDLGDNVAAIRNAVQYVRSSTKRCEAFEQKVDNGKMTRGSLPLDIKTRWNSTYLMLSKAINYRVAFDKMEAEDKLYDAYFMEMENGEKKIGPPTALDWNAVERLVRFLIIFYNSTLVVYASSSVCSYKCYGEIVTIDKNLMSLTNSLDKELSSKAEAMLEIFDKYWEGMKQINKILIAASVFDPRKKMQFAKMCFEKLYGIDSVNAKEMYDSVFDFLQALFKEYTIRSNVPLSQVNHASSFASQMQVPVSESTDLMADDLGYERMDFAYKEMVDEIGVHDVRDELDIYLKEKVENPKTILGSEWDVLSWWKLNSNRFPVLSEIARDVFAMQVSSVASESAFSTSGRVLEPHRSCLTHYMLEVLMCEEQWLKSELQFKDKSIVTNAQLLAEVEMLDKLEKEFGT